MSTRLVLGFLLLPALLASCANVQPRESFPDVAKLVKERSGNEIHWSQGTDADAEVEGRIGALLSGELTVDAAVEVALLNNRDLQALYEELGIAQADLVQAGLLKNPIFSAEIRFQEGGGPVEFDFGVSESFLGILFLPLRKRVAAAALEATKTEVAGSVLDLSGMVRAAYFELQGAEQLFEMRSTVSKATEASADLAQRLHEAGNIRDLDLAAERALHEQARVDVTAAALEVVEARERLNALMGVWGERTHWTATKRLPDLPTDSIELTKLESRAIARSLELGSSRQEIQRAAERLGFSRGNAIAGESTIGADAERDENGDWSIGPTLELPIPLFDQGQPALARASAELRMLQERYQAEAVRVRSDVRKAASRLLALEARARHYRNVLIPLRRELVEATQKQYNAMQVGAFQLLEAKQQEIEAGSQYIEALREYWLARTELDQLLAGRRARFERPELRQVHRVPQTRFGRQSGALRGDE